MTRRRKRAATGPVRNPRRALAAEREVKAFEMRSDGNTYEAIAVALGYTDRSSARKAVERAGKRLSSETPAELRTIEFSRLERLHKVVFPLALTGDLDAVDAALKIAARRMRLLGLDTPHVAVTDPDAERRLQEAQVMVVLEAMRTFAGKAGLDIATRDVKQLMLEALREVAGQPLDDEPEHPVIEGQVANG